MVGTFAENLESDHALGQGTLRVASVPENHVYVRHLGVPGSSVVRLPDPPPRRIAPAGEWWPPRMLEPSWVSENADSFDVFHIHFGFDACRPDQLQELVRTLHQHQKPLVYTVHDLRNPHHLDSALHREQIAVLVPAADELVTLTRGAAREIAQRFGRKATVLSHPHVVDEPWRSVKRPAHDGFVVGIHAKSLRASMDPMTAIREVVHLHAQIPDLRVRVDVHNDVVSPAGANHDSELVAVLEYCVTAGVIELSVHDCFSDAELWAYLAGLDVSVLPYRFGTHSGWLEACYDLGTAVVAPNCGYIHEQRPCFAFEVRNDQIDPLSLQSAVLRAHRAGIDRHRRAEPAARDRERTGIARAHELIYARAIRAARSANEH